jgi:uroporphyrinogen decarboxylase
MMNNKEWIKSTVMHNETKRVPYNFFFTPQSQRLLEEHYKTDDLFNTLDLPIRFAMPNTIKPIYAQPEDHGTTLRDEFGVLWSVNPIDRGAPIGPSLLEPDLKRYKFPDPGDEYRFEGLGEWCSDNAGHYTVMIVGDLWERATFMRGMENLLMDISLNPRFVENLLIGLTDYILETMRILCERFSFDAIGLSDDYGSQHGLLISPEAWLRFIKPCLARIFAYAKKNGYGIFLHSCGNIRSIIEELIDVGLDILHPIQPEAMDIMELKTEYGKDLTFCGGISTQRLLPSGTPGEIHDVVRRTKEIMGRRSGYICDAGINILADVPLENIIAFIEEAMQ